MTENIVAASKFLSLLLRHKPEEIGLSLDDMGWAEIEDIVRLTAGRRIQLTKKLIDKITATSDKKGSVISSE